jgi:hypothetical protein
VEGENCYRVIGGRVTVILRLEGEELLYWDLMERNIYDGTGGRRTVILGLEEEEELYRDWNERYNYTWT